MARQKSLSTKQLKVTLPGYLVDEVVRAAKVRSRVERVPVSSDLLVERALLDYLWLEPAEMMAGKLTVASEEVQSTTPAEDKP